MIFLEQPFTTLIDEVCLTRLFALVQTFIEENDNWEPKEISILLGLNTSIFKQFWLKFNNGETVEIDTVELTSALIRHVDRLFFKMEELNLDFLDGMIVRSYHIIMLKLNIKFGILDFQKCNGAVNLFPATYIFCHS